MLTLLDLWRKYHKEEPLFLDRFVASTEYVNTLFLYFSVVFIILMSCINLQHNAKLFIDHCNHADTWPSVDTAS